MKTKILYLVILTFVFTLTGCKFDNFNEPTSFLNGNVVYKGNPVGVRSGGTKLELWQYGYALRQKIDVEIGQDGAYSARLFDGNYKLVRLSGAPWVNQTDSIDVKVSGTTTMDVQVVPYYTITGETFNYSAGVITSSSLVSKVGTLAITSLTLYIGTTLIVDANNNSQNTVLAAAALTDLSTPKTIAITLNSAMAASKYIFVRLGVQTAGIGERLYTPVKKIMLQ